MGIRSSERYKSLEGLLLGGGVATLASGCGLCTTFLNLGLKLVSQSSFSAWEIISIPVLAVFAFVSGFISYLGWAGTEDLEKAERVGLIEN